MVATISPPNNFLGLAKDNSSFDAARAIILPAPYAPVITRTHDVRKGPSAIVSASRGLPTYDDESGREINDVASIATLQPPAPASARFDVALGKIHDITSDLLTRNKFVLMLGGSTSVSSAAVAAHAQRTPHLSILRFDARARMLPQQRGETHAPGSALRHIAEIVDPSHVVCVGVRSIAREEAEAAREQGIHLYHAHGIRSGSYTRLLKYWDDQVLEDLTDDVYVSVDVDVFDPSIMPQSSSALPNGLLWHEVIQCIRKVAHKRRIVGLDIVGFAPRTDMHHPQTAIAALALKCLHIVL